MFLYRVAGGAHDIYNKVYRTARLWTLSCARFAPFCDEKFSLLFLRAAALSPREEAVCRAQVVLTRAPPPRAMHLRPCAGGPRRTERRRGGRRSVRGDATPAAAGQYFCSTQLHARLSVVC